MVKTLHSQCRGHGSGPWSGTRSHRLQLRVHTCCMLQLRRGAAKNKLNLPLDSVVPSLEETTDNNFSCIFPNILSAYTEYHNTQVL